MADVTCETVKVDSESLNLGVFSGDLHSGIAKSLHFRSIRVKPSGTSALFTLVLGVGDVIVSAASTRAGTKHYICRVIIMTQMGTW